jgi:hypothetical protein
MRMYRKQIALERAKAIWTRVQEVGFSELTEKEQRAFMKTTWCPTWGYG